MNREQRTIKFRAWDKERRRMWPVKCIYFEKGNLQTVWMIDGRGSQSKNTLENTKLMQYTGLKDKNGKEIYEGDVIKVIDKSSGYPFEIGEVVYRNETEPNYAWGWRIEWLPKAKKIPQSLMVIIGTKIEIIGNIYENPELLPHSPTNE